MPSREQVVARVKGPSGDVFPVMARTIMNMVWDDEISYHKGVGMLTDMVCAFATRDAAGWREPEAELAVMPIVFDALQMARVRLMK